MRNGIRAHCAAEYQQNCGKDSGLYHRQSYSAHYLPLGCIENGGGFLKVCIHIAENSADKDIGKGGIMQSQNHEAGEQSLAPPHWHRNIKKACQKSVGGSGNSVGVKKVLPNNCQSPLGHYVRENEDGADIFSPCHVGAGNQKRYYSAKENRNDAGSYREINGIEERGPEVGFSHSAGEQVDIVDYRVARGAAC